MLDPTIKDWIDNADYESLLRRWRNTSLADPALAGETGEYYTKVLKEKRALVGDAEHVRASKAIGW